MKNIATVSQVARSFFELWETKVQRAFPWIIVILVSLYISFHLGMWWKERLWRIEWEETFRQKQKLQEQLRISPLPPPPRPSNIRRENRSPWEFIF